MKTLCSLFIATLFSSTIIFAQAPTWQWGYEAGGPGNDIGYSISTTSNGFSYVTGRFHATSAFGTQSITSYGGPDIFVCKYDNAGTCIWARHGGSLDANDIYGDEGDGIDVDANGNCYATGNFLGQGTFGTTVIGSSSSTSRNIFLIKYDSNGNVLWANAPTSSGSNNYSRSVSVDAAGNAWITGYLGGGTNTFGTFTLSGPGGYIVKYDTNGNVLFATKLAVNGSIDLYGVANDNLGNSYATGYLQGSDMIGSTTFTSHGMRDAVVIKVDATGNFAWLTQSNAFAGAIAFPHAVCCDPQNGIYISGYFDNTTIFGNDTLIPSSSFGRDCFLVKYDSNGNIVWAQQSVSPAFSSVGPDGLALATDQNSNVYMTGGYSDDMTFGSQQVSNNGTGMNTYIACFNSAGACQYIVVSTGQNPGAFGQGISTDNAGEVFITGYDKAPVIFGSYTTNFIGGEDFFIAKILTGKANGIETENINSATVYSSENEFHLSITDQNVLKENPVLILYDMTGRIVKQVNVTNLQTVINSSDLASGIYGWTLQGKTKRLGSGKISCQ